MSGPVKGVVVCGPAHQCCNETLRAIDTDGHFQLDIRRPAGPVAGTRFEGSEARRPGLASRPRGRMEMGAAKVDLRQERDYTASRGEMNR